MRVLTYPYSDAYTPSMPVVDLGVSRPGARQPAQVVTAVVDSGADGTLAVSYTHLTLPTIYSV